MTDRTYPEGETTGNAPKVVGVGCLALVAAFVLVLLMVPSRQPDPAAVRWIAGHPEYGSVGTHFDVAPWAEGERERHITTSGAELVFYLHGGSVVRVDRVDGGRRQVYP